MTDTELGCWTLGAAIREQDKKSSCTSDLFRSHQNVSVVRVWQTGTKVSVLILPEVLVYKAPTDISGSCKYPGTSERLIINTLLKVMQHAYRKAQISPFTTLTIFFYRLKSLKTKDLSTFFKYPIKCRHSLLKYVT